MTGDALTQRYQDVSSCGHVKILWNIPEGAKNCEIDHDVLRGLDKSGEADSRTRGASGTNVCVRVTEWGCCTVETMLSDWCVMRILTVSTAQPRYTYKPTLRRWLGRERERLLVRARTPVYRHGTGVVWANGLDEILAGTDYAGLAETFCSAIDAGRINASRSAIRTLTRRGETRCETCGSSANVGTAWPSDACEEPRIVVCRACDRVVRKITDSRVDAPVVRACLRVETRALSWQSVSRRQTRDLLDAACTKLAEQGRRHVQLERRKPVVVERANEWCDRTVGYVPHCALAIEMSGMFAALCVHRSSSPIVGVMTFIWGALNGVCEYYVGADVDKEEIEWLIEEAISATRECVRSHTAVGAVVAATQIECTAVQVVDNMTGILQQPELYTLEDYVRLRGVDIGVHLYTAYDDLSAMFDDLSYEATIVAILAHDLIDCERDTCNKNSNNLCVRMGDMEQLWDILEVCLSHTCAVAGEQWQQVVAGFVVGTCLYARGGRERIRGQSSVTITTQLRPAVEWRYAGKLQEYFESGVCECKSAVRCIDVHDALDKIYDSSAHVVKSWLNNQRCERVEVETLQIIALACASEVRNCGGLFAGKNGAQSIF